MNLPTAILLILVVGVFIAIVTAEIIKKKKGQSSCNCGGACGACPMDCHHNKYPPV